jgi:hypothetical protein
MTTYFSAALGSISARVVSTSNVAGTYANGNGGVGATLTATSNGALTVDSVSVNTGDVILLTGQSSSFQNGPYTVNQPGSGGTPYILQRAAFFQNPVQVSGGTFIPIGAGTVNAGSIWVLVEPLPVVMGTDAITFVKT